MQKRIKVVNNGASYWRWVESSCGEDEPQEPPEANPDQLPEPTPVPNIEPAELKALQDLVHDKFRRRKLFKPREDIFFDHHFVKGNNLIKTARFMGITLRRAYALRDQVVFKLRNYFHAAP